MFRQSRLYSQPLVPLQSAFRPTIVSQRADGSDTPCDCTISSALVVRPLPFRSYEKIPLSCTTILLLSYNYREFVLFNAISWNVQHYFPLLKHHSGATILFELSSALSYKDAASLSALPLMLPKNSYDEIR